MAKMCSTLVFLLLVIFQMGSYLVEAWEPVDGESLFDFNTLSRYKRKVMMPASCAGKSYCFDKGDDYPDDNKIEELLKNVKFQENLASRTSSDSIFEFRSVDTYTELDCLPKRTEGPIYYIIDTYDKVRKVVQAPKRLEQIHEVERCSNEGPIKSSTHFLENSTFLMRHKVECVTTKIEAYFIVLSEDETALQIATAKGIPACCKCRYDA